MSKRQNKAADTIVEIHTVGILIDDLPSEFSNRMRDIVQHCRTYPADPRKRSLTVKLIVTPHPNDPEDVVISGSCGSKIPAKELTPRKARTKASGQMVFNFFDNQEEPETDAA